MKQRRFTLAGQWNEPLDWIKDVKVNFQHTNYHHTEFASGEAGTTFQNNGWEGRIDVHHNKVNGFEGAFGVQLADFDFSALGEEAFIPPTHTKSVAGFGFEQTKWNDWTFQAGARIDSTEVKADEAEAFGPADKRTFTTGGVSFGVLYPLGPDYVIAASVVGTERPPNYQELYSNGPHLATGQFLIGDRNLGVEKSAGFDVSLRKRHGPVTGSVAFFYYRFKDFINQIPTGEVNEEFDIPIFVYEATRAQFYGFEFEGRYLAGHYGPGDLSFEVQGDYVWAVDLDSGQPLPRISPLRVGGAIVYGTDIWSSRLELMGVRAQNRVTENELPTSGYAMLNASLDYKLGLPKGQIYAFVKGTNLLDQDARNHVSVLNQIAPMGKRGVTVGLRGTF